MERAFSEPLEKARRKSALLKICLFATGLSGIVAEYILSTLASYFLGDSILQWTLVLSFMLFSMGLGSRWSRSLGGHLLDIFIFTEFVLSILVAFSALGIYTVAAYSPYLALIIYVWSIAVGFLIGLEIPLVTRLNDAYETLRVNISAVMEYDYFGSLAGGLFFALVGLPYLGLTYTPFVLGSINFAVATLLYLQFRGLLVPAWRQVLGVSVVFTFLGLGLGLVFAQPIIRFGEQRRYKDKIIYEAQSRYQKIVITQWKDDYWLFLNGSEQFSTLDEEMYHEPLIHPAMQLLVAPHKVLILGGGDGLAARELLKYPTLQSITLVDLDPAMTNLAKTHPVLLEANQGAMNHPKVRVFNQDGFTFLERTREFYDAIFIDLPDPRTLEINRLYTQEFYQLCHRQLRPHGIVITQSGSPYYSTKAFHCISRTLAAAGFGVVPMHNQVMTLGEWGWNIGAKHLSQAELLKALRKIEFKNIQTKWLNQEAMLMMTAFGKQEFFLPPAEAARVEVNTIQNPVLYRYYLHGKWDLY